MRDVMSAGVIRHHRKLLNQITCWRLGRVLLVNRNISTCFRGQGQNVSEERATYKHSGACLFIFDGTCLGGIQRNLRRSSSCKTKKMPTKGIWSLSNSLKNSSETLSLPLCCDNVRVMASIHPRPFSLSLNSRYVWRAVQECIEVRVQGRPSGSVTWKGGGPVVWKRSNNGLA